MFYQNMVVRFLWDPFLHVTNGQFCGPLEFRLLQLLLHVLAPILSWLVLLTPHNQPYLISHYGLRSIHAVVHLKRGRYVNFMVNCKLIPALEKYQEKYRSCSSNYCNYDVIIGNFDMFLLTVFPSLKPLIITEKKQSK